MNNTKNDYIVFVLIIIIISFLFYELKYNTIEKFSWNDFKDNVGISDAEKELNKAFNDFTNIFGDIGNFINKINEFPTIFNKMGSEMGKINNMFEKNNFMNIFKQIAIYISEFANEVEQLVVNEENAVSWFMTKKIKNIKNDINSFFTNIEKNLINEPRKVINNVVSVKTVFFKFYNVVKNNAKNIYNNFVRLIVSIITYFSDLYNAIFSYLQCGLSMLYNFPYCFVFYLLQTIGYIIYLPFQIIIWLLKLNKFENSYGSFTAGLSFPQSVQNKCYKCNNVVKIPCINDYI